MSRARRQAQEDAARVGDVDFVLRTKLDPWVSVGERESRTYVCAGGATIAWYLGTGEEVRKRAEKHAEDFRVLLRGLAHGAVQEAWELGRRFGSGERGTFYSYVPPMVGPPMSAAKKKGRFRGMIDNPTPPFCYQPDRPFASTKPHRWSSGKNGKPKRCLDCGVRRRV